MPDQREEDMLELMRDVQQKFAQLQNAINEMWAEWTRLHEPTIDRSGPKPGVPVRKVKRVLR